MEYIIWTNELDYEDWRNDLEEQYPDSEGYDEDKRIEIMYDINNDYLTDEYSILNKELGREIIVIANLGLWNGRRWAYRKLGTNLNSIFSSSCGDYTTWYVEDKEVKCKDIHHDGENVYLYRLLNEDMDLETFGDYAYEYTLEYAVNKYTESLGHHVAKIYGWEE